MSSGRGRAFFRSAGALAPSPCPEPLCRHARRPVTRVLRFNAAHLVHIRLSDDETRARDGKCNTPMARANYRLAVSVAGEIDARTGYVMYLLYCSISLRASWDPLDHRN